MSRPALTAGFAGGEDQRRALGGLPIIREMGSGVRTTALPIYDYATFAGDLDSRVHGG